MSAHTRKPLSSNTMSAGVTGRRQPTNPPRASSPSQGPSPSGVLNSNGIARSSSVKSPTGVTRPSRASVRRPGQTSSNLGSTGTLSTDNEYSEEDTRLENVALIDNLKKGLRNAELVSDDYQRQLTALQKSLDDSTQDHGKLEERLHESAGRIGELELQKKNATRQIRDMTSFFELERMAMLKDREEQASREMELKSTIQRLRETIAGREMRINADAERRMSFSRQGRSHSRSSSVDEGGQFAPPSSLQRRGSSLQRSDSKSTTRVIMQKDMVIESLRLELAESQIKLVEMENSGGDRMQELERDLLQTRMTNARLMEDNESFQLLLGEKTLNGDFTKTDFMQGPPEGKGNGLGSLAEELECAEGESENYRRLEAESKSLRDQNKALTLYIEKIISRVLQHENFETILDQKPDPIGKSKVDTGKDLPTLPPSKEDGTQPSVLQRAMSVVGGPRRPRPQSQLIRSGSPAPKDEAMRRSRPQSQIIAAAPSHQPSANEDPSTAPRIPIGRTQSKSGRGHRRTQSEKSDIGNSAAAAAVVNQMYRGPTSSGGGISPISPGGTTPRTSYFAPSAIVGNQNSQRNVSGTQVTSAPRGSTGNQKSEDHANSSSTSTFSRDSGEVPSPPRNNAGNTTYTGAVMTQSRLRPLRLVQENSDADHVHRRVGAMANDEEAAKKRANRGSWMGWFNRGKDEAAPRSVSAGQVQE